MSCPLSGTLRLINFLPMQTHHARKYSQALDLPLKTFLATTMVNAPHTYFHSLLLYIFFFSFGWVGFELLTFTVDFSSKFLHETFIAFVQH